MLVRTQPADTTATPLTSHTCPQREGPGQHDVYTTFVRQSRHGSRKGGVGERRRRCRRSPGDLQAGVNAFPAFPSFLSQKSRGSQGAAAGTFPQDGRRAVAENSPLAAIASASVLVQRLQPVVLQRGLRRAGMQFPAGRLGGGCSGWSPGPGGMSRIGSIPSTVAGPPWVPGMSMLLAEEHSASLDQRLVRVGHGRPAAELDGGRR